MSENFDADVQSIAALGEPIRRALYRYVVAHDAPVGRQQAAAGTGIAHHLAKFHLDKLVADGLLDIEYARPPGRGGPGAGRPTKLYRRSTRDISVTLPGRRYDVAGQIMARAITAATQNATPLPDALHEAAHTTGRDLVVDASRSPAASVQTITDVLAANGYEPRATEDAVILTNCPFHSLAESYRQLVCGMNLDLIDGMLDGLGSTDLCARLTPTPRRCCVTITRK